MVTFSSDHTQASYKFANKTFGTLAAIREKHGMILKAFCSCITHILSIICNGRYVCIVVEAFYIVSSDKKMMLNLSLPSMPLFTCDGINSLCAFVH